MRPLLPNYYSGPLFGLGALVAFACLACSWYQRASGRFGPATSNKKIEHDYEQYKEILGLDHLKPSSGAMQDLAKWSDAHHMSDLIESCRALADLQRDRMRESVDRSESQTAWAGRVLFCLGIAGVLAGLMSGYVTARMLTRRVAQLFVRVQAVQAHLDQEVGAMTVQASTDLGDLDQQLDRITGRVSAVCQRLQEQERSLLRAEQLAALGQLAAGVAHEVRNPLTGVKLLLQAAVQSQDPTPLTVERLRLLLQEVGRIERTVQGLVDLGLAPPLERQPQDLLGVIRAAIDAAQSRADAKSVAIHFQITSESLPALIDRDRLAHESALEQSRGHPDGGNDSRRRRVPSISGSE